MLLEDRLKQTPLQTLSIEGQVFSYRDTGTNSCNDISFNAIPVVMLHGIGSSSASWLYQYELLGKDYRLIAWDAPGYGRTTALSYETPSARDYANALDVFLRAMNVDRFYLLGHSLGAIIAASYASHRPKQVVGLMLANPAVGYGAKSEEQRTMMKQARLEAMLTLGAEGLAEARGSKLLSKNASSEALQLVKYSMSRLDPAGYIQAVQLLVHANLMDDTNAYDGPVEVCCGTEDQITPAAGARAIAKAYKCTNYRDIDAAGHASYIECPQLFNKYLKHFML